MNADADFRVLYEGEFRTVFRATYLLCGRRELAEDATQEAFARALARWDRLGHEPWVAGWVMSMAMNLVRRRLRVPKSLPLTNDEVGDIDDRIDLWRAIRTLPNRERHAILLHYRADMPVDHIAIVMGVRPEHGPGACSRAAEASQVAERRCR